MIRRPPQNHLQALSHSGRHNGQSCGQNSGGFSLIEMLVAMVILALSLGVLYQAAAGATRNVRIDERYSYAIQIAQSLLDEHAVLQPGGISRSGVNGDFEWSLYSEDVAGSGSANPDAPEIRLHRLDAVVSWGEPASREVRLSTVVPVVDEDAAQ